MLYKSLLFRGQIRPNYDKIIWQFPAISVELLQNFQDYGENSS